MCFLVSSNPECSLKGRQGYTFIIACAGVGNVGQLCMDVLISSIESAFAGYLNSPHVPPVVGPPPYPELSSTAPLACSLELYDDDSRRLSLLQVRVPVFPGARDRFATEIVDFIMQQKFSRVVLLSSSFAMTRKDQQLRGPPLQYSVTSATKVEDIEALSRIGLMKLVREEVLDGDNQSVASYLALNLPGSGAALPLFSAMEKAQTIPAVLLNTFTCDGDNRNDAFFMAHALNGWLKVNPVNGAVSWKTPKCWKMLYGNSFDPALY
ncbi:proteasome assembly chaperone 2 [Echinococcus multilocularis]|uniref:Proteasome assembly chaperone 2 n=1 Tax=Echinococcus multilocularis TaxID=6211 RepID=A0A087W2A0_ECHMU|nr:proteasome assembly chaperone 2 [Echinococcus multilocularis]